MTSSRHIAILIHENEDEHSLRRYAIATLMEFWLEDGHRVTVLRGTGHTVDADLLVVHVDLSVVPRSYLEFASQYPITVNSRVGDIRKSAFAINQVTADDPYDGAVIIKSDLNCMGNPEARLLGLRLNGGNGQSVPYRAGFRMLPHVRDVPPRIFRRRDLVVQKFEPEMDGPLFCVRNMHCLGNHLSFVRLKSRSPVVKSTNCLPGIEPVEPEPELIALRQRLHLDYGKLDYVKRGGEVILLDINKTIGAGRMGETPQMRTMRRARANGLYDYFS